MNRDLKDLDTQLMTEREILQDLERAAAGSADRSASFARDIESSRQRIRQLEAQIAEAKGGEEDR